MPQGFTVFTLNEYRIGLSTDPISDDYGINFTGGKYLTLLNSFIPAGSYILPGGDENAKIPLIPKVSYLIESVHSLTVRINKVGRLTSGLITLSQLEASPLVFAWSDNPIFTQAPMVTSSIESYVTGATYSQVDTISGRIDDIDLILTFLTLYPLVGIPAYNFFMEVVEGDPSRVDDTWMSLQFLHQVQGQNSIFPVAAQTLSANQASATQVDYGSNTILKSETSYNIQATGFGAATDSDALLFNITPSNQFPNSRAANVAFSERVLVGSTDILRVQLPANFFCETIIISSDATVAADGTVSEQFLLAGGGTVDEIIATLSSGQTQSVTQLNRIISQTLEMSLSANAAAITEFIVEFRGQVIS